MGFLPASSQNNILFFSPVHIFILNRTLSHVLIAQNPHLFGLDVFHPMRVIKLPVNIHFLSIHPYNMSMFLTVITLWLLFHEAV